MLNAKGAGSSAKGVPSKPTGDRARSVQACNFRSAGRLSNENARSLTAIHEGFARQLASALDVYLGTAMEVKLQSLDQIPLKDHIASIPPLSYIVPFSLSTMPGAVVVECDVDLMFPMIEVLLGGSGGTENNPRELSEIEEEIMHDVTSLIARQAEFSWHMPNMALVSNRRIKSSLLHQYCPANEKVTLVKFQVEIAGVHGSFQLVFPTSFLNALLKQIKLEQPQRKGGLRYFPIRSIRERVQDCDVVLAAGFPRMRVAVRDLIALQPGCLLKLRTPVRTPGMLTVGDLDIFQATPVRNGSKKAAQLGHPMRLADWGKE
ncbi:MAG: flagellar motor switch protein FliM [Acidobacteriaceae bacterium]